MKNVGSTNRPRQHRDEWQRRQQHHHQPADHQHGLLATDAISQPAAEEVAEHRPNPEGEHHQRQQHAVESR